MTTLLAALGMLLSLAACACSSKPAATTGTGPGSGTVAPGGCEGARAKIEQLYRAEAQAKQPPVSAAGITEAVSDNTAMVMAECAKAPAQISACAAKAATAAELERTCLAPLDDEGSETDVLVR